ncbi:hypothetical protein PM085_19720 [Halorubrum ezzemoulense]|uniref:Uncharacterized protein n=1 Tax=Halorubrum ezzemoulense TaxID=337243 RepID=A0ABT4Z8E4_HALEZ|nr:hypothetical protein [Halorubrum ezzemoulense]
MTTNTDSDDSRTACCDNPAIAKVPTSRFNVPGSSGRQTSIECANCGTIHD